MHNWQGHPKFCLHTKYFQGNVLITKFLTGSRPVSLKIWGENLGWFLSLFSKILSCSSVASLSSHRLSLRSRFPGFSFPFCSQQWFNKYISKSLFPFSSTQLPTPTPRMCLNVNSHPQGLIALIAPELLMIWTLLFLTSSFFNFFFSPPSPIACVFGIWAKSPSRSKDVN